MSLPLTTRFGANPLLELELANKAYVDSSSGGGNTFARVVKKVDESRQSDTTMTDDAELFVPLEANKNYGFETRLFYQSSAAADFKVGYTIPSLATGLRLGASNWHSTVGIATFVIPTVTFVAMGATLVTTPTYGRVIMGATAGDLNFQWAQNAPVASDTTVKAGSRLVVWEELP